MVETKDYSNDIEVIDKRLEEIAKELCLSVDDERVIYHYSLRFGLPTDNKITDKLLYERYKFKKQ